MFALADHRLPDSIRASLVSRGFELILLPPDPRLSSPVASHPDMLLFPTPEKLIVRREYYASARAGLERVCRMCGLEPVLTDESVGADYPDDVLFNAVRVGKYVFGRHGSVSHHILKICSDNGYDFINIRQGYAKCSTCVVDNNAVITSDAGIADAARGVGIDVLLISPGSIRLDGYDTGFIGGASGFDVRGQITDEIYFLGSLGKHPDGKAVAAFCASHGKRVVSLSDDILFDAGTLFFI